MAKIKVPYLVSKPGKAGRRRHFWQPGKHLRARGFALKRLSDDPAIAVQEALAENERVKAALQGGHAMPAKSGIDPDSVEALVRAYAGTEPDDKGRRVAGCAKFERLRPKTQAEYRYNLSFLVAWAGDKHKRAIIPDLALEFYETMRWRIELDENKREIRVERRAMALAIIRTACLVFYWDRLRGRAGKPTADDVARNPFARLGLDHSKVDERDPETLLWSPAAIDAYVAKADAKGLYSLGTAIIINSWIGQRLEDLVRLPRTMLLDANMKWKQSKRGRWVVLPAAIVPALRARMELQLQMLQQREGRLADQAAAKRLPAPAIETTLLVSEKRGGRFNPDSLADHFEEIRDEIRADPETAAWGHLTLMHLRHTAITSLAAAGCSDAEISSISGHSQETIKKVIDRYAIRTAITARQAFEKRIAAEADRKGE